MSCTRRWELVQEGKQCPPTGYSLWWLVFKLHCITGNYRKIWHSLSWNLGICLQIIIAKWFCVCRIQSSLAGYSKQNNKQDGHKALRPEMVSEPAASGLPSEISVGTRAEKDVSPPPGKPDANADADLTYPYRPLLRLAHAPVSHCNRNPKIPSSASLPCKPLLVLPSLAFHWMFLYLYSRPCSWSFFRRDFLFP